jgi:3-oxoacyl-[acyl-carrier protein] reductase
VELNGGQVSTDRVALVTGGGGGIGSAICRRLAADGCPVVVGYLGTAERAAGVVEEIEAGGGRALALRADVGDPDGAAELVQQAGETWGPVTVLVNNAGYSKLSTVARQSPGEWRRILDVNLNAAYYCTHAAMPAMLEARWGRIVFISSSTAHRLPMAGASAYAAAKAGLSAMARCIAKEVVRRDITVNCVMPGFVDTDMTRAPGDDGFAWMEENWPKVPAEAIAECVSFLVSDAAAYVSGEEIGVWRGGPSYRP